LAQEEGIVRTINLDATRWTTIRESYTAILSALGAPKKYGCSVDALLDGMVWSDQLFEIKPPYTIRISGAANLPKDVKIAISDLQNCLVFAREFLRKQQGRDVEVELETDI
jgi:hypothetical protein